MNYATIKYNDIANGTGVRTSLFVSGCTHKCKGCFNSEAWDFNYGKPFDKDVQEKILASIDNYFIDGLSLLGGEPFEPENQIELYPFLLEFKKRFPNKTIWCYTGYLFDKELLGNSRANISITKDMLSLIDVLVDGRFIEAQKNISLQFRGSENQRIIDVKKSLEKGEVVDYDLRY
ncbi:MAG: anaerobic ribonucleoside-triphosphate reductase activating protein [Clostridiales bacterium]|nr:anaerobic ribonucleoside-triphosphate reductase activating protein [Clostridiales bacterium]